MNRALLVGINKYPTQPLYGCVNDVIDMSNFLVEYCNFKMDEIRLLVDERATKEAIMERLGWLLTGVKSGDRILFHFSGHGLQLPTRNPQGEVDGLDEAICPVDFDWTDPRTIRDKDFNKIFSAIPSGVKFIWVSDSCNSQDLSKSMFKENKHESRVKRMNAPADIIWRIQTAKSKKIKPLGFNKVANTLNLALLSGCESDKTSADTVIDNRANGAFTYFLLSELKKTGGMQLPLNDLVVNINTVLDANGYEQNPQLEGSPSIIANPFLI